MKRDPRLRKLSEEHHHALVLARRLSRAADSTDAPGRRAIWAEARRIFADALAPHFAVEERLLLPALEDAGQAALVDRTLEEHRRLRSLIEAEGDPGPTHLGAFGALLRDHVRFEERVLFPTVERELSEAVLEEVTAT